MSTLVKSARVVRPLIIFLLCAFLAALLVWRGFTFAAQDMVTQLMCTAGGICLLFTGIAAVNPD